MEKGLSLVALMISEMVKSFLLPVTAHAYGSSGARSGGIVRVLPSKTPNDTPMLNGPVRTFAQVPGTDLLWVGSSLLFRLTSRCNKP